MAELGFWNIAQKHPDRLALVTPDENKFTFGELLSSCNQLVHGMRAMGLKRGDTIATVLDNEGPVLEIFFAAAQAGIYVVPINHHLVAPEIAYIAEDSQAKIFICNENFADTCHEALETFGFPKEGRFTTGTDERFKPLSTLKQGQPDTLPEDRAPGTVMNYTSGTTGRPKGVRRPIPSIDPDTMGEQLGMFLMLFGMQPLDGVHLCGSPLYHTAVLNFSTYSLHMGHTVVIMGKWQPEDHLRLSEIYKVTHSHMVPTQFHRLLGLPEPIKTKYDLSSYRHMIHSAAPCPVETKKKMLDWWGPCVYEYYAASEGGGTLVTPEQWLKKPGSVGMPWPISQIRVLDDNGEPCKPGDIGTVFIRMGDMTFEYHGDKDKTKKAWSDGFFTVGDAGYLDEDGFLFLCDRKADMIISGGVNIYPAEIEAVLFQFPQVADVAVFGIPHEEWGEQVKAVIEMGEAKESAQGLADDILAFCRKNLAKYKCPKSVEFIENMPRDPNGKLMKRKLRDPYWEGRERMI
jgi:long-chain acyl-CoA synthetase